MAEKYYSISPYAYVINNPLKYIDPLGTDTVPSNEVWEYHLVDYRTDGSGGSYEEGYYPVIQNGKVTYRLHKITSGENEGNYIAIGIYGETDDGYEIYNFDYIIGADKVDDFREGKTEGSGYLRGAVKAAKDGGFDGRKSPLENAASYIKNQWHPLNIMFSLGTRNPLNPLEYKSLFKSNRATLLQGTSSSTSISSGSNRTYTSPKGTKNNPLKGNEIVKRLK